MITVKKGSERTFVVIDAAMNDLIRPTLYEAHHEILPVSEKAKGNNVLVDVVGPICETGDFIALGRKLPLFAAGDLVAVMSAGAYGAVQAGTYNSRQLVPEVLVRGDQFAVIRERQSYDELIGLDRLAPWQTGPEPVAPKPVRIAVPAPVKPVAPVPPKPAARKPEAATAGAASQGKRPTGGGRR